MAGPHTWIKNEPSAWAAASFDTGLLPANSETVIFDERGQGDVVSGLGQSAVTLTALDVRDTYEGDIGSPGAPLDINASLVRYKGQGSLHIDGVRATTIITSRNLQDAVTFYQLNSGERVRVTRGFVTVEAGSSFATYWEMDGVDAYLLNKATTGCTIILRQQNGHIMPGICPIADNASSYWLMNSGSAKVTSGSVTTSGSQFVVTGGNFVWAPTSASTFRDFSLMGGTLNALEGSLKTITVFGKWKDAALLSNDQSLVLTAEYTME